MAYPISDNWYSISPSSSPATYFSVQDTSTAVRISTAFEMTNTTTINSDWQFIASTPNDFYYIRNHGMGPDVQLTVTTNSVQQAFGESETVDTVNFATANDSDPNQQWVLQPAQLLFFIQSNAPPKEYLRDMNPWFGAAEYNASELWIFGSRGSITETAFTNTLTSAPVPTASITTGSSSSPHRALYIGIGAPIIALILAKVIGLFLYKKNAARRKRLHLEGSEHELDYVHANFPTVRSRTDPELPLYHEVRGDRQVNEAEYYAGRAADIQAPPPIYSPQEEEDPVASLARSLPPQRSSLQQSSAQQPSQPPEYENPSLRDTVAGTVTVGEEMLVEEEPNNTPPEDLGLSPAAHERRREEEVIDSSQPETSHPPEYSDPSPEEAPATIARDSESTEREVRHDTQAYNTSIERTESPP